MRKFKLDLLVEQKRIPPGGMWAQTFENVSKESVKQRKVALAAASPRTRGHAPRPGPAPSGPRDGPDPGSLRRRAPAPPRASPPAWRGADDWIFQSATKKATFRLFPDLFPAKAIYARLLSLIILWPFLPRGLRFSPPVL